MPRLSRESALTPSRPVATLAAMTTNEIAKRYVELCRANQQKEILEKLFSQDVVSVEPGAPPGMSPEARGIAAIAAKSTWWADNHEVHSAKVDGPWPHGNRFIVRFTYDITHKPSGNRFTMDEAALFTVEGEKIVREEFFYSGA